MRRSELVKALALEHPRSSTEEIKQVITTIFHEIMISVVEGKRVELRGFGTFTTRFRDCSKSRNPQNGVSANLGNRRMLYFREGKTMAKRLNKLYA
jgi:integration host factor subunit beta